MRKFGIFIILITGFFLSSCVSLAQDITPPPGYQPPAVLSPQETAAVFPLIPADPQNGKLVYDQNCADCHGISGRGNGAQSTNLAASPDILVDPIQIQNTSPVQFYQIITQGIPQNDMPAFQSVLEDRERWDVTAYLYLLSSTPDELTLGKDIYEGICSECHGDQGKGDGVNARGLPLQPPDFTRQGILTVRSNQELFQYVTNGSAEVMPSYEKILSEAERLAVVKFVRTLSFANVIIPTQTATKSEMPSLDATAVSPPLFPDAEADTANVEEITEVDISGKVFNASGSAIPTDMGVELLIFDSMEQSETLRTTAAVDGSFEFKNVPMQTGRIFIASTTYQGRVFNSAPSFHPQMSGEGQSTQTQKEIKLDIQISDSTTSIDNLVADRLHIFFDFPQDGIMQVVELWLISNNGSTAVVPSENPEKSLKFLLPTGATNLQFQDSVLGERYLPIENGFMDSAVIPPGQSTHQVLYAYDLPYNKKTQLSIPIPMNTTSVSVMIPVDGVKLKSDQLLDSGVRGSQEMTYRVYTTSNMTTGSELVLDLSGQPKGDTVGSSTLPFNPILLSAGVLVLVITGILYFYFGRKDKTKTEPMDSDVDQDKDALMDAIITLDEQYKSGKIDNDVYQQRRQELKNQLRKLV